MKNLVKCAANAVFFLLTSPAALLAGFGRWAPGFTFFAHAFAFVPGVIGEYARRAYYAMTLSSCSTRTCISFGTFFAHREATVEDGVYIGAYCILGRTHVGANTQIASNVHVLSGRRQHPRDGQGKIQGAERGVFQEITIGANCWIGTSAVVMSNVGEGSTIGAGAVVTRDIPAGVVAVGCPAQPIKPA